MHPRWCQGGGSSGKVGENKNERSTKWNSNRKANKVSVCNLILIGFPQHTQKSCAGFNVGRSVTHWCPLALLVASRNASLSGSPQGALLPARLCSSELRAVPQPGPGGALGMGQHGQGVDGSQLCPCWAMGRCSVAAGAI